MTPPKSPAVEALEQEQARLSQGTESELEASLKGSFPASDPVSATTTSVPTGIVPSLPKEVSFGSDAPLVDKALAATREPEQTDAATFASSREELEALKAEVARLRESASEIGSAAMRVAKAQASDVLVDLKERIRAKPLPAVGIAAVIGFVCGMNR
ncbi:hypothetical protein AAIH70_29240 [Neorhizobium sp. BT27B]|uniref:hypothetical protein n=1 Tax=Neorhizobium sp. BT27B TaxID=3142625 RepID=UPI003D2B8FA3